MKAREKPVSDLAQTTGRDHRDARFWNRIAKRYARMPVANPGTYETKLAKTDSYLDPGDRVLEIGCGTGTTALHHASRVAHILATDISPQMIAIAQSKADAAAIDNVSFEVCGIDALDTSARFDVILAHNILHLVADVPGTLHRLHRMLKPGGLLISSTRCIGDFAAWLAWIAPLGRVLQLLPRLNVFREPTFMQWIADAGFDVEEVWQPAPKASHYVVARARQ